MKVILPPAVAVTPERVAVSVAEPPTVMLDADREVVSCGTRVVQLAGLPLMTTVELAVGEVIVATLTKLFLDVLTVAVQVIVTEPPDGIVPVQDHEPTPPVWVIVPDVADAAPKDSPEGWGSLTTTLVAAALPVLLTVTE